MSSQRSSADPRQDGYRILHEADLRDYLAGVPAVAARLGGAPASWTISEVGDGNLNLVFIVKGDASGIAVKQALPYVRLVGESWPLPLSRSHYEYLALTHQARLAPGWCRRCCITTRRSPSSSWSCSSLISSCARG
jgi:5-methylthioribose kinase